jgi:hypothetical protein
VFYDRSTDRYKVAKKFAKRIVSEPKGRAYDDLYQRLSTKEGEKDALLQNWPLPTGYHRRFNMNRR